MAGDLDPLIRDMLEWVGREPRSYREVMEAWRTSCPRLTVWEDATERGLIGRELDGRVSVTARGRAFLARRP
jgi:hypothetical protein